MATRPPSTRENLPVNAAGNFQAAKEGWLKTVASYPNMSGADLAIAIALSTYFNSRSREAWPSHERLASDINRNRSTVWRSLVKLERLELLDVVHGRGRRKSNRYRPRFGSVDCEPKTLRRRNKSAASSQPKGCELAARTSEGSVEEPQIGNPIGATSKDI
jgi:hypothetical protein